MWRLQATFVLFWGVAAGVYAQELDRPLRAVQEFNDDTRDAGGLGAGHSVTALYEIIPADSDEPVPGVDPLRYRQVAPQPEVGIDEVLTVKLRYKQPGESESRLVARTLTKPEAGDDGPSEAFRFASAVAEFRAAPARLSLQGRRRVRARLRTCPRSSRCRRRRAPQRAARADPRRRRPDERPARVDRDDRRPDTGTSPIGINPALYLYRHAGNRLVEIASDDDGGDKHLDSRIVATLDSTETYLVAVREFSGRPCSVTLSITPAGSTQ